MERLATADLSDEEMLKLLKAGGEHYGAFAMHCGALWNAFRLKNWESIDYITANCSQSWQRRLYHNLDYRYMVRDRDAELVDQAWDLKTEPKRITIKAPEGVPEYVQQLIKAVNELDFDLFLSARQTVIDTDKARCPHPPESGQAYLFGYFNRSAMGVWHSLCLDERL